MCPEDDYDSTDESENPEQETDESIDERENDELIDSEIPEGCEDWGDELVETDIPEGCEGWDDELVETETHEGDDRGDEDLMNNGDENSEDLLGDKSCTPEEKPEEDTPEEEENAAEETDKEETDRSEIYEKSEYSDEVNDKIASVEELEIYQKAGLRETVVDGRICLVRDDIDMDYVDVKTGCTNRELMEKGRAPYDAKTGEQIELHHIGQDYDSPLAELTSESEHGKQYAALHSKESESWRNDAKKNNEYNNHCRPNHWKARAKEA